VDLFVVKFKTLNHKGSQSIPIAIGTQRNTKEGININYFLNNPKNMKTPNGTNPPLGGQRAKKIGSCGRLEG
jgi:hypothetical protein